jgi:hypothetical protein
VKVGRSQAFFSKSQRVKALVFFCLYILIIRCGGGRSDFSCAYDVIACGAVVLARPVQYWLCAGILLGLSTGFSIFGFP